MHSARSFLRYGMIPCGVPILRRVANVPRKNRGSALSLLASLVAVTAMVLEVAGDYPYNRDEGISLYAGVRVLEGQVPYRDFFHITTPGAAFLLALIFRIFGAHLLSARLLVSLALLFLLVALYKLGRNFLMGPYVMSFALILVAGLTVIPDFGFSTHRIAVLLSLLGITAIGNGLGKAGYFFAGCLTASSFLVNQNIGLFSAVATGIIALTHGWFAPLEGPRKTDPSFPKKDRPGNFVGFTSVYLTGVGLTLLPLLFYLLLKGAFYEFVYDTLTWTLSRYVGFNVYPYYSFESEFIIYSINRLSAAGLPLREIVLSAFYITAGYLPYVIYPVFLLSSFFRRHWRLWCISMTGLGLFLSNWNRPDYVHIIQTIPPLFLLSPYLLVSLWRQLRKKSLFTALPFSLLGIFLFLTFIEIMLLVLTASISPKYPVKTERGIVYMKSAKDAVVMDGLISYVTKTTKPGNRIFVYHWSPVLYYLCNRDNPTSFDTYKPMYNTPHHLDLVRRQLERSPPLLYIKDDYIRGFFDRDLWQSKTFPGVDPKRLVSEDSVDPYIKKTSRVVGRINGYIIFRPLHIVNRPHGDMTVPK